MQLCQQLHSMQRSNVNISSCMCHKQLPHIQHVEKPIDDLAYSFAGRWNNFLDRFCGLKSCMVGVFTNVLLDGVNWNKSAAMFSQEVERQLAGPGKAQMQVRPVKFEWEDDSRAQTTTVVAVYAPVVSMVEVKGIGNQLAFDKTDKEGLGLSGSHFHTMANLRKVTKTRNVILSSHATFISNYSMCAITAETHDLDKRATTNLCKDLLPITFHNAKNIHTK